MGCAHNNTDQKGAFCNGRSNYQARLYGAAVTKAQEALICRGYNLDSDGIFGAITRNRVIAYQLHRSAGEFWAFSFPLHVDGIVGPQTWSRLTPPVIKKGSKGDAVYLLQEILKSLDTLPMILVLLTETSAR